ncbi:MAG: hypothetical protein ACTSPW_21620 [Promethearchaeota archaeon]
MKNVIYIIIIRLNNLVNIEKMLVRLTEQAIEYIKKNQITSIFIDVSIIREMCLEIDSPIIKIIEDISVAEKNCPIKLEIGDLKVFISKNFNELFGNKEEYLIDVDGFFEKKLMLKNIRPITKNICNI